MDFARTVLGHDLAPGLGVEYTKSRELWYKINFESKVLYLPTIDVLQKNVVELDKAIEALTNFYTIGIETLGMYNWDDDVILGYCVSNLDELEQYKGFQLNVSCDIETKHLRYDGNKVLLIGFCWEDATTKETKIFIADETYINTNYQVLQKVFNNVCLNFIWHNGKFDTARLKYLLNIDAYIDDDTMLMHYVGINEKRGTHGLKQLAQLYVQAPAWEDELDKFKLEWCRKNKVKVSDFTYDMIPSTVLVPYLRKDVLATYRLYQVFKELMRKESQWIYNKLIEAANVFKEIELNGVKVNLEYISELKVKLKEEEKQAQEVMDKVTKHIWNPELYCQETGAKIPKGGIEFNPKSPKQMTWFLSKLVGFDVTSSDRKTIEKLAAHLEKVKNEEGREFLQAFMTVRKVAKYYDTYAVAFEELADSDGRLRGTYNLHGTETGRLSSSDPNMQNVPRVKEIKRIITCEPGNVLINLDMSQAEIRTLAAVTGDHALAEAYYEDKDLHATMAEKVFGNNWTKDQRSLVKTVTFGLIYGRGPGAIAEAFNLRLHEASKIIDDWFRAAPEAAKWLRETKKMTLQGIEYITPFGRTRHYVITEDNAWHIQNEAVNFPIQSIASDMTLLSILDIYGWIRSQQLKDKVKIVATVHDSIVIECENDMNLIKLVIENGKRIMESQAEKYDIGPIKVPFKADAEYGLTYGDMEEFV